MKILTVLEQKVASLANVVKELRLDNELLLQEKNKLKQDLAALESAMLKETKSFDELQHEKEMTKAIVDNLIKSIDSLMGNQK